VEKAAGLLEVDTEWYLAQQLHPPLARLCEPIEGIDAVMLAEYLGMDASKIQTTSSYFSPDVSDDSAFVADVLAQDEERFKSCEKLSVKCPVCHNVNIITSVVTVGVRPSVVAPSSKNDKGKEKEKEADQDLHFVMEDGVLPPTLKCPTCFYKGVTSIYDYKRVANILTNACRKFTNKYNDHWMKCTSCEKRQRLHMQVLKNKQMICRDSECKGKMEVEYKEKQLYLQLQYFKTLFDVQRAFKHQPDKLRLFASHEEAYGLLNKQMEEYLELSGYGVLSCKDLFGLVKVAQQ